MKKIILAAAAALQADQTIDSVLAVGPHVCEAPSDAIDDVGAGMLPGASIPSGPGFVDASNAGAVAEQAGVNR